MFSKNKRVFVLVLLVLPAFSFGQGIMDRLKQKVKTKTEQRIEQKADKGIDKVLDKAEDAAKPASTPSTETAASGKAKPAKMEDAPAENPGLTSYSKFDFIPGEEILYSENFEQEAIGELPTGWNTSGTGEVVTLNNFPGKWLQIFQKSLYLTSNKKEFGDQYTIEFDVILQLKNNGHFYPYLSFGFFSSNNEPADANSFLREFNKYAMLEVMIHPADDGRTNMNARSLLNGKGYFTSEWQQFNPLSSYFGKPVHIAMQVQKERFRMWINQDKVFDVPKGIPQGFTMNQLQFQVHPATYKEDEYGMFISNLKVAKGVPDARHKLVDEGKFSTTGILFDVNSDVIRPESYGVIKDIAKVMKEHEEIRVRITGHTDSDGNDAANLTLSQKRAAAVMKLLSREFGIELSRMQSDGKGELQPVGDNKTKEGRAANRRVEFTRL